MAASSSLRRDFQGVFVMAVGAFMLIGASAWALRAWGADESMLRVALRISGRFTFVAWWITFVASPVHLLAPGRGSRFLLRHRRLSGLFFAGLQAGHGYLIARLFMFAPATRIAPSVLVGASLGMLVVAVMAATSFALPARLLGIRRWSRLHRIGTWYVSLVFAYDFIVKPFAAGASLTWPYLPFAGLLVGAWMVRAAGWMRRRAHNPETRRAESHLRASSARLS